MWLEYELYFLHKTSTFETSYDCVTCNVPCRLRCCAAARVTAKTPPRTGRLASRSLACDSMRQVHKFTCVCSSGRSGYLQPPASLLHRDSTISQQRNIRCPVPSGPMASPQTSMGAHRHGQGGCLLSPGKVEKCYRVKKHHFRSQFERPRRCFSVKKNRSTPTISFLYTIKE